jgi:3-methylfumaryl-CoA hydratase
VNSSTNNEDSFSAWIGKSETNNDTIDARPVRLMRTIMDSDFNAPNNDELPPLWHWLYFPTTATLDELGPDGHPKLGGFLPPVELPRRMWAGGRLQFFRPLRIGDQVEKKSSIKDIATKNGRTGKLCFVTVVHEFMVSGDLCIREEHDIVYRENAKTGITSPSPPAAPDNCDWSRSIKPGPVMLFRYSALTFNGHRIHYDVDYCRDVEGFEGRVFHGPLTATLLVDLAVRNNPDKPLRSFDFRAISPLFDTKSFLIAGQNHDKMSEIWAQNSDGRLAMKAEAVFD